MKTFKTNVVKLKECKYPKNGFGGKSGMAYLLDQFGNIYDLQSEYDSILDERYYYLVDRDGQTPYFAQGITGIQPAELIANLKNCGIKINRF